MIVYRQRKRGMIRVQQPLILIDHLHISDFDSKIIRFFGNFSILGRQ